MGLVKKLLLIAAMCCWTMWSISGEWKGNYLKISVLNVGQGDGMLVEFPNNIRMLIDGGPGAQVMSELGEVIPPWIRTIDILVLTHEHDDHLNGLFSVIKAYQVKEVVFNENSCCWSVCEEFRTVLSQNDVSEVVLRDEINTFETEIGGVGILFWIDKTIECGDSLNDGSVVVMLTYGSFRMILNGDLETNGELHLIDLLKNKQIREIPLLKAGHHCSRTASSDDFLLYINPSLALCSLGADNSFGHPHIETIERFDARKVSYLRTDIRGRIEVYTDGARWWASAER